MIVTCSKCSKRYMLDDILIPKEGRQVRCIACQHVWQQVPESLVRTSPLPFSDFSFTEESPNSQPSCKKSFKWFEIFLFFAIAISFLNFLIFGRNMIMTVWPQSEKGYALFGLSEDLPGAGLSVSNLTSFLQPVGATEMIVIGGDITNTSAAVRPLPPLKVKILNNMLKTVDHWEHSFPTSSLPPGKSIHFETAPRPKVAGTQTVSIEF